MFSVIIPAYNAAFYIRESVESVLKQTIEDFEIIIVDDGSTDDTQKVVAEIDDYRVRYIYQSNGGVSAARNTGIRNATGEYICFLDADDLWKPQHLEVISRLVKKYPQASVYLTGYEILLNNGQVTEKACGGIDKDLQTENMFRLIRQYGYFFHTNSVVCLKSAIEKVGLFEVGVKNGEDDDMWYRLFSYFTVALSKEVTTTYIRENSKATVARVFNEDWIFLHRVEDIMASADVTDEKKHYLRLLLEQRKISYIRHCILQKNKKYAWKMMWKIDYRLVKKKKYIGTLFALFVPSAITSYFIAKRDENYYVK